MIIFLWPFQSVCCRDGCAVFFSLKWLPLVSLHLLYITGHTFFLISGWDVLDISLQITLLVFSVVVGMGWVDGFFSVVVEVGCWGFFGGFFGVLVLAVWVVSTIPVIGGPS